jgi:hypothetical protein
MFVAYCTVVWLVWSRYLLDYSGRGINILRRKMTRISFSNRGNSSGCGLVQTTWRFCSGTPLAARALLLLAAVDLLVSIINYPTSGEIERSRYDASLCE